MSFLTPLLLLLGLLGLPILVLYMLKLRRREVEVSSTLLWQQVLRDRQANAPWQRLRRNLLLLLQLLILAALVLALARPAMAVPVVASGSVVVLLDASASMSATDVEPSRFEVARAAVKTMIDGLDGSAKMTLILVEQQPVILAAGDADKASLRRALESATPTEGAANWETALALAAGASAGSSDRTTTVIVSDGGLPETGLPPIPGEIRYIPIGHSGENLAISALALRPSAGGAELFASVTNFGETDASAILSFYRNGELFTAQPVTIPAGKQAEATISGLPADPAIFQARLSPGSGGASEPTDNLSLDDSAFASYQPPRDGRVLVVTSNLDGNFFLEQILTVMPGITPYRALPKEGGVIEIPPDPFDVYVFDGYLPGELPDGDLLIINPPTTLMFSVSGVFSNTENVELTDSPLTAFVDWSGVHVLRAKWVQPPPWARVLIRAEGGPLVFAGETGGRRIAVITFDLHDSDLPLQIAFPILLSNLINYLSPSQAFDAPDGLHPGDGLTIRPGSDVETIAIASPKGNLYTLTPTEEGATFVETGELGVYAVNYLGADPPPADYFAVNLFDDAESDIRPKESITLGRASVTAAAPAEVGLREFWPWLAALSLVVLVVEWWVYHRRQGLSLGQIFSRLRQNTRRV